MNAPSRQQRFAGIAARELREGPRREPVWKQALTESRDADRGEILYIQLRVSEMMKEEEAFEASEKMRIETQLFHDRCAPGFWIKTALFVCAITGTLLFGLFFLLWG